MNFGLLARNLLFLIAATAGVTHAQVFGTVESVNGNVHIVGPEGQNLSVQTGQQLTVGQTVQTQSNSEVHIATQDGGLLALRANTSFQMLQYKPEADSTGQIAMSLVRGALRSISGWIGKINPKGYRITTPTATIGIRGTDHETTVLEVSHGRDEAGTYDSVLEGATLVRSGDKEIHLEAGEHGFAPKGEGSALRRLTERPDFLAQRRLLMEDRIQERKERLKQQLIEKAATLPEQTRSALRAKLESMDSEAREAVKKRLLRKPPRRSSD